MNEPPAGRQPAPWWAYTAPVLVFLALTQAEPHLGPYPTAYGIKIGITSIVIAICWTALRDIQMDLRVLPQAIGVGLAVFAMWALVERWIPYPHIGARAGYDPNSLLVDPKARTEFLVTRFYGLALVAPVIEELFWRSFVLRYLTNPNWQSVEPWQYSLSAFAMMCVGFAIVHPEWLAALICAAAYGLLLRQTRSLFACVVAHGVTNLALGVYVMQTGIWRLW